MLLATLFTIAKTWKSTKCPVDEWIQQMWYSSEEWPRKWGRKTQSSPPPTGHTKITAIYRTTIDDKDWYTNGKDLLQLKI